MAYPIIASATAPRLYALYGSCLPDDHWRGTPSSQDWSLVGTRPLAKKKKIPEKYQRWIDARKCYHFSHAHIQMTRELGLNPKKFGSLANTKLEPWKLFLPEFIEDLYIKHFKKNRPDNVRSIEQIVIDYNEKKKKRKMQRSKEKATDPSGKGEWRQQLWNFIPSSWWGIFPAGNLLRFPFPNSRLNGLHRVIHLAGLKRSDRDVASAVRELRLTFNRIYSPVFNSCDGVDSSSPA